MATSGGISGTAVAMATAGGWLLFAGIRNLHPITGLRDLMQGRIPAPQNPDVVHTGRIGGAIAGALAGAGEGAYGGAIYADATLYLGKPYVYGAANPLRGFDCSGLVNWVIGHDLSLPLPGVKAGTFTGATHGPDTHDWQTTGLCRTVSRANAARGDLVVWSSHMGIVADAGAHNYLYAPEPGQVVKVGPVDGGGPVGEIASYRRYTPPQTGQPGGHPAPVS